MGQVEKAYDLAKDQYAALGVDTEEAMRKLSEIPIAMHCWQGDDVVGFEGGDAITDGGIMTTGNYPGRARNGDELRMDAERVFSMVPGTHRFSLHALYAETGGKKISRENVAPEHFLRWIEWAKGLGIKLDFNPSFFSHPNASAGFTLASLDKGIRDFWIEHGIACRKIGEKIGKELDDTCINDFWIPDGYKDIPANRLLHRELLVDSLDNIFKVKIDEKFNRDAVESKLFGIGSESYVVGSHEFYMGYAITRKKLLCVDAGHYHPTETIADKVSALLLFVDELLLHVSRGVRWDSDHVVILNEDLKALAQEIVRGEFTNRVHIGLDFFDASINRIAAWTIGMRNMVKALLLALLEPTAILAAYEADGDFTSRLSLMENLKSMPFGAVWDYYCEKEGVPQDIGWLALVKEYEKEVLSKRG